MVTKSQSHKVTGLIKSYFLIFVLASWRPGVLASSAFAQPVSSVELINNAKQYDAKTITYEGEVIGEVMVRGNYAWINLHDGKTAIGVWLPKELTKDIVYSGSYKSKGDWLEVVGTFQRACAEHGGDLDIHAQAMRKINSGRMINERLNLSKRNLVWVLLGILGVLWILRRLKRR